MQICLIVSIKDEKHWRRWLRYLIKKNKFSQIVIQIYSNSSKHNFTFRNLKINVGNDTSIYNSWNIGIKYVENYISHFIFLGVGDKIYNLEKTKVYNEFDIIYADNNKRHRFIHSGTIFSSNFLKTPFNEDFKIIADLDQYLSNKKKLKLKITTGAHSTKLKPFGISYNLSNRLFYEYLMILKKHPLTIIYVFKKIIFLMIRSLHAKS